MTQNDTTKDAPAWMVKGADWVLGIVVTVLFLNTLMFSGLPAALVGYMLGQYLEAVLLGIGVSALPATAVFYGTVFVVWAVPTILGWYIVIGTDRGHS